MNENHQDFEYEGMSDQPLDPMDAQEHAAAPDFSEQDPIPEMPQEASDAQTQEPPAAAPYGVYGTEPQQSYYAYNQTTQHFGSGATPSAPQHKAPKKKRKGLRIAAVAVCCALIGSIGGGAIVGGVMHNLYQQETTHTSPTQMMDAVPTESSNTPTEIVPASSQSTLTPSQVYEKYVSSVVGIANESTTLNVFGQATPMASSGTGFIISSDGEILTNYHVVQGANRLTVTLNNGTEYDAKVLGYEALSDVALLKIDASGLNPVKLGNSDNLKVGSPVAAIGNPLGELTYTMTVGYVSAKDREINTDGTPINMMQIDAAINSGNSGGPLFDMQGNVIGINTAKYSGTTNSGTSIEGIGFAIPINDIKDILDDLRTNGAVLDRAYIGVTVDNVDSAAVEAYGLPEGAVVTSVVEGSCGEAAGLRKSDIITAVDDHAVESTTDLSKVLKQYRAGDEAVLTVWRSGQMQQLKITFDERPQQTAGTDQNPSDTEPDTTVPSESNPNSGWTFPWSFLP